LVRHLNELIIHLVIIKGIGIGEVVSEKNGYILLGGIHFGHILHMIYHI